MVPILPIEIIEQIVYYLPNKAKIECLVACQHWYDNLYRVLVHTVHIHNKRQLKQFLNTVALHAQLTGPFTREFHVKNHVGITLQVFRLLSRLCPNIEIFKFRDWRHYQWPVLNNFKNIRQLPLIDNRHKGQYALLETSNTLTHLELSQHVMRDLVVQGFLLPFLSLGVNLTHLSLDGYYSPNSNIGLLEFNFTQLDLMHKICQHLKSIRFNTVTLSANQEELETMQSLLENENVNIVPQMSNLELVFLEVEEPIWITYIAAKYPNLTKLELRFALCAFVSYDETTETLDSTQCQKSFMDMASKIFHLKSLTFTRLKASHFPGGPFFDTLTANGVKLETLRIRYLTDILTRQGLDSQTMNSMLQGQSNTLKKIDIDMWVNANEQLLKYLHPLSACSRLVDLSLASDDFKNFNFIPIPIELILDECIHLVSLELVRIALVANHKQFSKRRHPLKKLHIGVSRISEYLFQYLTERCPSITYLEVSTSFWFPRTLEMRIDMYNNSFEYLRISDLNKLNMPRLEGNLGNGASVNLFAVTQLDKVKKKTDRYRKRNCLNVPNATDYYHLYEIDDGIVHHPPSCLQRLHKREVDSLKYLIEHYNEVYYHEHMGLQDHLIDRCILKKQWREDIHLGYLHIKCKSIRTLKYNFNVIQWPA